MGWKTKISILLGLLLLVQFLSGGVLFNMLLPNYDYVLGKTMCVFGGFIIQPVVDIGDVKVPVPTTDDLAFASITTSLIGIWVFRKYIQSTARRLIAVLITFGAMVGVYKLFGYVLIYYAETYTGMQDCLEIIDLGVISIPFRIFEPLWFLLMVFGFMAFIGYMIKIFKDRK